jgi:hypothetical protein
MPAQSEIELFNFHEAFQAAAHGVLDGIGVPTLQQMSKASRAKSLAVATFQLGPATDDMSFIDPTNQDYYRFSNCELAVELYWPRDDNEPLNPETAAQMSYQAAQIRNAFREYKRPFTSANLPYYDVISIRPNGEQFGTEDRMNRDLLTMRWSVDFTIRPDAWPVGD